MFTLYLGKLPVSFPQSVGTTPVFYNYLKGSRPIDAGLVTPNDTLVFGHQVRIFNHCESLILMILAVSLWPE